ncbi:hypothetical protein cyc_06274 [Cyclospora cayetanensis]|uniref:STEEP1 domain-containing protein n=1 Tax=Cyclospora cayetanensis TaxID=88456 RepID=A0A1D3D714_9EIME|nr:hypothetical protein cyc_06274 [Cyclospora cayetanensis]
MRRQETAPLSREPLVRCDFGDTLHAELTATEQPPEACAADEHPMPLKKGSDLSQTGGSEATIAGISEAPTVQTGPLAPKAKGEGDFRSEEPILEFMRTCGSDTLQHKRLQQAPQRWVQHHHNPILEPEQHQQQKQQPEGQQMMVESCSYNTSSSDRQSAYSPQAHQCKKVTSTSLSGARGGSHTRRSRPSSREITIHSSPPQVDRSRKDARESRDTPLDRSHTGLASLRGHATSKAATTDATVLVGSFSMTGARTVEASPFSANSFSSPKHRLSRSRNRSSSTRISARCGESRGRNAVNTSIRNSSSISASKSRRDFRGGLQGLLLLESPPTRETQRLSDKSDGSVVRGVADGLEEGRSLHQAGGAAADADPVEAKEGRHPQQQEILKGESSLQHQRQQCLCCSRGQEQRKGQEFEETYYFATKALAALEKNIAPRIHTEEAVGAPTRGDRVQRHLGGLCMREADRKLAGAGGASSSRKHSKTHNAYEKDDEGRGEAQEEGLLQPRTMGLVPRLPYATPPRLSLVSLAASQLHHPGPLQLHLQHRACHQQIVWPLQQQQETQLEQDEQQGEEGGRVFFPPLKQQETPQSSAGPSRGVLEALEKPKQRAALAACRFPSTNAGGGVDWSQSGSHSTGRKMPFQRTLRTPRKRALCVGCLYTGSFCELEGGAADARRWATIAASEIMGFTEVKSPLPSFSVAFSLIWRSKGPLCEFCKDDICTGARLLLQLVLLVLLLMLLRLRLAFLQPYSLALLPADFRDWRVTQFVDSGSLLALINSLPDGVQFCAVMDCALGCRLLPLGNFVSVLKRDRLCVSFDCPSPADPFPWVFAKQQQLLRGLRAGKFAGIFRVSAMQHQLQQRRQEQEILALSHRRDCARFCISLGDAEARELAGKGKEGRGIASPSPHFLPALPHCLGMLTALLIKALNKDPYSKKSYLTLLSDALSVQQAVLPSRLLHGAGTAPSLCLLFASPVSPHEVPFLCHGRAAAPSTPEETHAASLVCQHHRRVSLVRQRIAASGAEAEAPEGFLKASCRLVYCPSPADLRVDDAAAAESRPRSLWTHPRELHERHGEARGPSLRPSAELNATGRMQGGAFEEEYRGRASYLRRGTICSIASLAASSVAADGATLINSLPSERENCHLRVYVHSVADMESAGLRDRPLEIRLAAVQQQQQLLLQREGDEMRTAATMLLSAETSNSRSAAPAVLDSGLGSLMIHQTLSCPLPFAAEGEVESTTGQTGGRQDETRIQKEGPALASILFVTMHQLCSTLDSGKMIDGACFSVEVQESAVFSFSPASLIPEASFEVPHVDRRQHKKVIQRRSRNNPCETQQYQEQHLQQQQQRNKGLTLADIRRRNLDEQQALRDEGHLRRYRFLNYSSEDSALQHTTEKKLRTFYCSCCGANACVSEVSIDDMPRRGTDSAYVLQATEVFHKLYVVPGKRVILRRPTGFEVQYQLKCRDCGVAVAYRSVDFGETAQFIYIYSDAICKEQSDAYAWQGH